MVHDEMSNGAQAVGNFAARCVNPLSVGFALFLVWQTASFSFLFPSSASMPLSPLFVGNVSAVLLLILCFISYRLDAGTFTPAWSIGLSLGASVAGCIASVLVAQTLLPTWGIYVASAVLGFSSAMVAFVWATAFSEFSAREALANACFSFLLANALDLAAMHSGYFTIPVLITCCGVGSWLCFLATTRTKSLNESPLLVRPTQTRDFFKLAVGIALFAVALGIVAGTTADVCTEDSMLLLNHSTALAGIVVATITFIGAVALRGRINALSFIKTFAPCLVVVILLNIVDLSHSDIWLTLTIFAWSFLRLCVFLVLVEVDRQRIVSLPLVFPAAWAVLLGGYALGVFAGQNILPLASDGVQALMNSIVLVAVLVVFAAVLLLSNKLVMRLGGEEKADSSTKDRTKYEMHIKAFGESGPLSSDEQHAPSMPEESLRENHDLPIASSQATSVSPDPPTQETSLESRCERIGAQHKLSARESEVLSLLAQGHTRASIAKKLFVSENTIREHVKNIYKKLYIHSRQQLIDMVDAKK